MYSKFCLTLCNDNTECDVIFDIFDTDIAQKWASEVAKKYEIFERDRFSNWPNSIKDGAYLISMLNEQIDIVNRYYPNLIDTRVEDNPNQDTMNYLHKFFENLRGSMDNESVWYLAANIEAQEAICQFNILIHEYEHFCFSSNLLHLTDHPYATIVGTYKDRPRFKLTDSDYEHFTFKWRFGTVYSNYCEVGKPLLDVFKDNDEIIGDHNIKPLKYYSADWQIKFGLDTLEYVYNKRYEKFKEWFDNKSNYLNQLGITWGPTMALGLIPVAQLNITDSNLLGLSKINIVNNLSQYQKIAKTQIL